MSSDIEVEPDHRMCDSALTLAFSVLGKRWNGLILGVLGSGPASFGVLRKAVTGISDTVLSERLSELAEAGLIRRSVTDGPPVSVSYELTPSGIDLSPLLTKLASWARENMRAAV